jgi:hypothetical protein
MPELWCTFLNLNVETQHGYVIRNLGGLCEEEPKAYLGILTFMARSARNVKPIPPRTAPTSLGPWSVPEQNARDRPKIVRKKDPKRCKAANVPRIVPPLSQLVLIDGSRHSTLQAAIPGSTNSVPESVSFALIRG